MRFLSNIRAKKLAGRGEFASALNLCNFDNVEVLSKSGMHLSAVSMIDKPSIHAAISLASIGELSSPLEMAAELIDRPGSRTLYGFLAVLSPAQISVLLDKKNRMPDIKAFCDLRLGLTNKIPIQDVKDNLLLCVKMALARENFLQAKEYFDRLYLICGLLPPLVNWEEGKIDVSTLHYSSYDSFTSVDNAPLISVILTAANEERYLVTAVESLLNQTWRNIEVIIIDDGSTDTTYQVSCQLADKDGRIRVVTLPENSGTWKAKNLGLQQARGEFITMHDADDWSHPEKLNLQVQPLISNNNLMCSSSYLFRIDELSGTPFTRNAASYLRWNPCSLLYRREILDYLGNYFPALLGGDCEFAARIETRWGTYAHRKIKIPLTIGWQRSASLSNLHRAPDCTNGIVRRLKHWEEWRRLHAKCYQSGNVEDIRNTNIGSD